MELKRKGGVLAHITSFPSKYGIGDLGKGTTEFLDFLYNADQKLWQILPLGPTSFGDSPYQCFSTFAGNQYIISLDILIDKGYLSELDLKDCPDFSKNKVEYGKVIKYKNEIFKKAKINFYNKLKGETKKAYEKFVKDSLWLEDYALFMALKYYFINERDNTFETQEWHLYKKENEKNLTKAQINDYFYGAVWNTWPKELVDRTPKALKEWKEKLKEDIELHKFLQFEFFQQWKDIKTYANKKGIEIIGDIPIFVAMDSADVWCNKELFKLDEKGNPIGVAGCPPDYFEKTGQLWGNPLYDWVENKNEGYKWWIRRTEAMLKIVDYIRIDHFRGFDEYWAIPYGDLTAENGVWEKGPGKDLFKTIEKALEKLPIIAEDLGEITKSVVKLRDDLKLPGMKILHFAFQMQSNNAYLPHNIKNSNCVIYTGTHDNDTSIGWYEKTTENERDYLRRYLNVSGENVAWDLIRLAWSSSANFAIVPIQDILSEGSESRMNKPGSAEGNWQYRITEGSVTSDLAEKMAYLNELFER
ncbi:MAG: 4-alpha-glucanotransferase [Lachnospirales bacterium]